VEKEFFLDLAKNYTSLTIEETNAIDELQQTYPYSQVIHCLATRGAQDHQLEKSRALLGLSAVYATDRAVLKSIMTAPRTRRVTDASEEAEVIAPEAPAENTIPEVLQMPVIPDEPGLSADALNEEIMRDLARLQELKVGFEESFIEFNKVNARGPKKLDPLTKVTAPTIKAQPPVIKAQPPVAMEQPPQPPVKARRPNDLQPHPTGDSLIDEIANTRKRVAPETEKQKEQIEIIDQFISKQPRIQRPTQAATPAEDLAESSSELADSMVSETLVEILLRQGKKEKAVEVLRKLIWKFPQKKAIFAAQIDELKT
jgi:hypothetical protein